MSASTKKPGKKRKTSKAGVDEEEEQKSENLKRKRWKEETKRLVELLKAHVEEHPVNNGMSTVERRQWMDDVLVKENLVCTGMFVTSAPDDFGSNPLENVSIFRARRLSDTGIAEQHGDFVLHMPITNSSGTGFSEMSRVRREQGDGEEEVGSSDEDTKDDFDKRLEHRLNSYAK